jgi:hypothetical protein
VEGKALSDGDEILVGRYRLNFFSVVSEPDTTGGSAQPGSLFTSG